MNHIKDSINQQLEQDKQNEENRQAVRKAEYDKEQVRIGKENTSKQICYLHFEEYVNALIAKDSDISMNREQIAGEQFAMRNNIQLTAVRMEQSHPDYKICVSFKGVKFAEMYKDSETPANSIKLHLYQPSELVYIIEFDYFNDSLHQWQHHVYPYGAKNKQKTYDDIKQLFDYTFSK